MNQFYSIVLPDGTEVFDKEYGYYVEENGSYVFEIKKKVNGNVSSAFKKTIEVADIDRRNSNALADRTRCVGTYVDSYSSNSLKYTLCDTGYYIISSIWLSNPYNQIKVGLGGNPTGLRTVPQIMSTEVPQNSGKAYLATNGSLYVSPDWPDVYDNFKHISGWNYTSVSSILINDGKIIHDYHDQFDSGSYYLFGLSKDGYLKEYTLSGVNKPGQSQSSSNSNDKKNDKTIDKMINTDLIRYSLVTSQKIIPY